MTQPFIGCEMEDEEVYICRGNYQPPLPLRGARATPSEQPGSVPSSSNPDPPNLSHSSSSSNVGGRPPHPHASSSLSETGRLKQIIRNLEAQNHDLRTNNRLLQALVKNQVNNTSTPDVAKWEHIKPHMKKISKNLMLGVHDGSSMFPREEQMKQEILALFDVGEEDILKRSALERAWEESLRTKVKTAIINQRGRFASCARLEFFRLLGVPKPQNASQTEIETWKSSLIPFKRHNCWRWRDDDPFGSDAIYGSIAYVLSGKNYSTVAPISILSHQLAWFAYVLDLAVDGDRNMKETELRFHQQNIKGYKTFIFEKRDFIRRFNVIYDSEPMVNDVLETDVISESSPEE